MKPSTMLALLTCLCAFSSRAQDVTVNTVADNHLPPIEKLLSKPEGATPKKRARKWKKEHDKVYGHIDHAAIKVMAETTGTIFTLLNDSCLSVGPIVPTWHEEFVSEKLSSSSRTIFGLVCEFQTGTPTDNTGMAVAESGARLRITANDFAFLFRDTLNVNGKVFQTLRRTPVTRNGFPYFEYAVAAGDTINVPPGNTRLWLITPTDSFPYVQVTRREYLQEAMQEVKLERNKLIADIKERIPVKSAEAQKAAKERDMEEIGQTYSGAEKEMRLRNFLAAYKSDEDYQKEGLEKGTVEIDSTLHFMENMLAHWPDAELKKPAVVTVPAVQFAGFEDSVQGSRPLVKVNPSYYNNGSTGEKAQCFLVCWNYDPAVPMAADLDRQLNEKFDFKKLQGLLGK